MVWIYVVILSLITEDEQRFHVKTLNLVFKTESSCQTWREHDMLRLYETRPDENSRAVSQCVAMPFKLKGDKI